MADGRLEERVFALERDLQRTEEKLERLLAAVEGASRDQERLAQEVEKRQRIEEVLLAALDLTARSEVGDRGVLEDMDDSILRLEDYLLAMGERVERILGMLQTHKELLDRVGESVIGKGERDRLRLELDIAMNSISILALAGVEIDPSIPSEMETLRRSLGEEEAEIGPIRERKEDLVKRLEGEIRKYDLDALFARRVDLPGYR